MLTRGDTSGDYFEVQFGDALTFKEIDGWQTILSEAREQARVWRQTNGLQ